MPDNNTPESATPETKNQEESSTKKILIPILIGIGVLLSIILLIFSIRSCTPANKQSNTQQEEHSTKKKLTTCSINIAVCYKEKDGTKSYFFDTKKTKLGFGFPKGSSLESTNLIFSDDRAFSTITIQLKNGEFRDYRIEPEWMKKLEDLLEDNEGNTTHLSIECYSAEEMTNNNYFSPVDHEVIHRLFNSESN